MIILLLFLVLIDLVVITWLTEGRKPSPFGALFFIIGSLVIYHFFIDKFSWNTIQYIQDNKTNILMITIGYILIGIVWSFIRWYFYLVDNKKYQDIEKRRHEKKYRESELAFKYYIPKAIDNKERIMTWMIYWPFSIFGFILSNPFTRFFSWIYSKVSGVYDSITASVYK